MAVPQSYVISWNDSIESIAESLTGDETQWRTLAQYNSLTYPYIVNDLAPYAPVAASGSVTVTGPTSSPWTIPVGFLFAQPALRNNGYQAQYAATSAVTGGSGTPSVSVPVTCVQSGHVGNCGPGAITVIVSSGLPATCTVTNAGPFFNGSAPNVLGPGDTLLIPPSFANAGPAPQSEVSWLDIIGGTSLQLSTSGDLVVAAGGSLATTTGAANLLQNWAIRVLTQRGDFLLHPGFGTEIEALGTSGSTDVRDLILADIRESIRADPRVADVTDVNVSSQNGTSLAVSCTVIPVGQNTKIPLSVLLGGT